MSHSHLTEDRVGRKGEMRYTRCVVRFKMVEPRPMHLAKKQALTHTNLSPKPKIPHWQNSRQCRHHCQLQPSTRITRPSIFLVRVLCHPIAQPSDRPPSSQSSHPHNDSSSQSRGNQSRWPLPALRCESIRSLLLQPAPLPLHGVPR